MARRTTTNSFAAAAAFLAVALAAVASLSPTPALAGPDFNAEAAQPVARPITLAEKYALLYEQRLPPVGFQVGALNPSNAQLVRLLVDQPYPSSYSLSDAATRYVASIQKATATGTTAPWPWRCRSGLSARSRATRPSASSCGRPGPSCRASRR